MVSSPTGRLHEPKMTHTTRADLTNAIRSRYRASSGEAKRRILEEFIAATGYHEKSALRVLNCSPTVRGRQTRQRPSISDEAVRAALIVLWEASDRVFGKRLKALVPILLPALERNGHLKLNQDIRKECPIDERSDDGSSVANTTECNSHQKEAKSGA